MNELKKPKNSAGQMSGSISGIFCTTNQIKAISKKSTSFKEPTPKTSIFKFESITSGIKTTKKPDIIKPKIENKAIEKSFEICACGKAPAGKMGCCENCMILYKKKYENLLKEYQDMLTKPYVKMDNPEKLLQEKYFFYTIIDNN